MFHLSDVVECMAEITDDIEYDILLDIFTSPNDFSYDSLKPVLCHIKCAYLHSTLKFEIVTSVVRETLINLSINKHTTSDFPPLYFSVHHQIPSQYYLRHRIKRTPQPQSLPKPRGCAEPTQPLDTNTTE
jgi:hypothetical protein